MSTKRELYRDPAKGKIAGVCAGVATYFGMEVWLVRILVITAALLGSGPFFVVAYIAAWFILDKKPNAFQQASHAFKQKGKGWYNDSAETGSIEVKTKVWQSGETAKQACQDLKQHYTQIEQKLRNMEHYVTSTEFQLNREISKL